MDAKNGGLGYLVYTVPDGEKLIGNNFKLNPNAKLGYSDGKYYYTPDDWYDEVFSSNFRQEYNVNISGRSDKLNYYASVGYLNDSGIIQNSAYKRYTGRAKVDYQAKEWLKVGTNIAYTYSDSQAPDYQDGDSWGSSANLFYVSNTIAPIYPLYVRNADGSIAINPNTGYKIYDSGNNSGFSRPSVTGNAARDIELNRQHEYTDLLSGKWYANITPIEGLTLTANISANVQNSRLNQLSSAFGSASADDGSVFVQHTRMMGVNNQYLATYARTFADKHNADLLVGYEQYRYKNQVLYGENTNLYNPYIGELNNAGGIDKKNAKSYTDNYMTEGILSRLQYNYDGKYFLSASYRRDASSRFHKDHRWGNFGSVGLAWLISQENFMYNAKWVDMLKFKASYGIQGNDNLGNYYAYADQYSVTDSNGDFAVSFTYKGNKDITWETSYAFNTGVDFELFGSRLNGTIEYFNRKTVDLLYNQPVPISMGYATIPMNVGSIVNQGVEIDLNGVLYKNNNIEWLANVNATHYKNKITDLAESAKNNGGIKYSNAIYRIGGSLYNSYLPVYAGVDHDNGKALYYVDPDNGDYNTTDDYSKAKQSDLGSTLAKVYGGFGTQLNAYGVDLSVQFSYQLGGKLYDGTYEALMHRGDGAGTNFHKDVLEAWTPENPNSNVPRLCASDDTNQKQSSRFLVSSDYLSLNSVMLGYTFPKRLTNTLGISSLRLYVSGENLAVISGKKGLDPRQYWGLGSSTTSGSFRYSALRTISGGITLKF